MAERMDRAVSKASKARLLEDFARAAQMLDSVRFMTVATGGRFGHGFALGAVEATASLTVKAALLTAFGR